VTGLKAETGYEGELRYFIECIQQNRKPTVVTAQDGVEDLRVIEAEAKSIESGQVVRLVGAAAGR
jgi:predicted dehydrogenase